MGGRYYIYTDGKGILLSCGDYGLGEPEGIGMEVIQYPGRFVLGTPEIFNTDQGSQFTSGAFTDILKNHRIDISMDGKGRWLDNAFIERLWWSVKYQDVYLKAYSSIAEARKGLSIYFDFYNSGRRHQSLDRRTPDDVYWSTLPQQVAA